MILIYEGGNLHQIGTFWTKKVYEKVGGLNSNYEFCMDYDFFCRVAEKGELFHIKDYLANFRVHKRRKSSTREYIDIGHKEHKKIMRRYIPKNISLVTLKYKKCVCTMRRFYRYVIQGEIDYIFKGLVRRILSIMDNNGS